jgi:hypothetical protein
MGVHYSEWVGAYAHPPPHADRSGLDRQRSRIRLPPRYRTRISKLAVAEFAKQMLHMPGVVHSSPPFPADTFQMAKTDDDFHFEHLHLFYRVGFTLLSCVALRLVKRFHTCRLFRISLVQLFVQLLPCLGLKLPIPAVTIIQFDKENLY